MAARSPEPAKRCASPQSLSASAAGRRRVSISASTSMAAEMRAAGVIARPLAGVPRRGEYPSGTWTQSYDDLAGRSPDDWEVLPDGGFEHELKLELGPVHRLYGVPVQGAARRSSNDDVLFRHTGEADLWSVVHLTWTSKQELRLAGGRVHRHVRGVPRSLCTRRSTTTETFSTSPAAARCAATLRAAACRTAHCRWCRGRACRRSPGSAADGRSSRA